LKILNNAEVSSVKYHASKQSIRPFSRKVHNLLQQRHPRDLQKVNEVGNWLFVLGSDLNTGKSGDDLTLEEWNPIIARWSNLIRV
jgi:hypothetical protein